MGPGFTPHLMYANLEFDSLRGKRECARLAGWCQLLRLKWNKKRIARYLRSHQAKFRHCLEWLVEDAVVDLEHLQEDLGESAEHLSPTDLLEEWSRTPEARFLQLHGLSHAGVGVRPRTTPSDSGVLCFWGVDLGPGKPKDPLDPICWHLLHLLMRDGTLDIRRCKYWGCEKFFRPPTKRKVYCSDLCRAKDHAKSPEEWREYMQGYRANLRRLSKAKGRLSPSPSAR
jgi:hypothetical protein